MKNIITSISTICKSICRTIDGTCYFCGKTPPWRKDFFHGERMCLPCWEFQYVSAYPFKRDARHIVYLRLDRKISEEKYVAFKKECLEKIRIYDNERDKRNIKRLEKSIHPQSKIKKRNEISFPEHPFPKITPFFH